LGDIFFGAAAGISADMGEGIFGVGHKGHRARTQRAQSSDFYDLPLMGTNNRECMK